MSIDRRKLIGLFAVGSATTLAGCGGGVELVVSTRSVWLLNLNPEFPSVDVSYGPTTVVSGLSFPALTPRIEVDFGIYSIGLRNRASGRTLFFDGVRVDENSPSMQVFYRKGASARLGASPTGIVNYFDSPESLIVELDDGVGGLQTSVLDFESSTIQTSRSSICRLQVRRVSDRVLVYDSGLRQRTGSILLFPSDPLIGFVGAVGLNYDGNSASMVNWPNIL